jgi:ABC-type Fe3+ transport system permease subunit
VVAELILGVVGAGRFSKVQKVPVPCAAVAINAVAIIVFMLLIPSDY